MMTEVKKELTGADADYGYEYGCEGFISQADVAEFLGVHQNTVRKYCRQGYMRKGKHPDKNGRRQQGHAFICKRSFREYVKSTEI